MRNLVLIIFLLLLFNSLNAQAGFVSGTGFFITENGYLVTANHVVGDSRSITVKDSAGITHSASIVAADTHNDLIILKIDGMFSALPIASSTAIHSGAKVITMGFPHIDIQGGEPKVTEGIISSSSGIDNDPTVFQISVPVQSGNSGGALVNMDCSVVGIINSKLNSVSMLKNTGDLPQNVNYAVKSNYLIELIAAQKAIEGHLLKPKKLSYKNTEQVVDAMAKSVVLVIAEVPDDNEKKKSENQSKSTEFPSSWISMADGSMWSVKLNERKVRFVMTYAGNTACRISARGEAENGISGTLYYSVSCGPGWSICNYDYPMRFYHVTPEKIDGYMYTVKNFNTYNCYRNEIGTFEFSWVPN